MGMRTFNLLPIFINVLFLPLTKITIRYIFMCHQEMNLCKQRKFDAPCSMLHAPSPMLHAPSPMLHSLSLFLPIFI